jgi:ComF family protein
MPNLQTYLNDFLHLIFPHHCLGCGTDILEDDGLLCMECYLKLPFACIFDKPGNAVEKLFYGRLPVEYAGSAFYFTRDSVIRKLLLALKYRGNAGAGVLLGDLCGKEMAATKRFKSIDLVVPVPLSRERQYRRGYNQATVIATAIAGQLQKPVVEDALERVSFYSSQTALGRMERQQNMEGRFRVARPEVLQNRHVLLVDDVVTTGATLEVCGHEIVQVAGCRLSIATAAFTAR